MSRYGFFGRQEFVYDQVSNKGEILTAILNNISSDFEFCMNKESLEEEVITKETFLSKDFYLHPDQEGRLNVEYIQEDQVYYGYQYLEDEKIFLVEDSPWEILIRKYSLEAFSQGIPQGIYAFEVPREVLILESMRILLDEYKYQWDEAIEWVKKNIFFFESYEKEGELTDARLKSIEEEMSRRQIKIQDLVHSQDLDEIFSQAYSQEVKKREKDLRKKRKTAQTKDLNYPNPLGLWIGADLETRGQVKKQVDQIYKDLITCPQLDLPDLVFSLEGEGHFAFNQDIRLRHKIKILPQGFYTDIYVTSDPFLKEFYETMGMEVIWEKDLDLKKLAQEHRTSRELPYPRKNYIEIKVHGRVHDKMYLVFYKDQWTMKRKKIRMKKQGQVFVGRVRKDLLPCYYNILVEDKYEVVDPFAKALSLNNRRGYIFDPEEIPKFSGQYITPPSNPSIYELHVKDFTIHPSSQADHPGTFEALGQAGLKVEEEAIGIDYLEDLKIDYVHLLPVQNFLTMWEQEASLFDSDNYNWGYDPDHYFALENSYGVDPSDPLSALKGFRRMIDKLHERGIGVIMDVVYNHLYLGQYSDIAFLEPEAVRRREDGSISNGSGTGSELASENPYVRKIILDSIAYFQNLGIDGFRFDLAGLTDKETFFAIERETRERNPQTILYGEPWMAEESSLSQDLRIQPDEHDIYFFDNWYRDALRGSSYGSGKGYIQGQYEAQKHIVNSLKGLGQFKHSLTYFSCHDDDVIMDHLDKSMETEEEKIQAGKLAFSLLAMNPMPILFHEADEFLRRRHKTNPYNGPLENVEMNWGELMNNKEIASYVKELLLLRSTIELEGLEEVEIEPGRIVLISRDKNYILFFNNQEEAVELENYIQRDDYICIFDERGNTEKKIFEGQILPAKSFYACKKIQD